MIYFIFALLCIFLVTIGIDIRLHYGKTKSGSIIILIAVSMLLADFYVYSVDSALKFGKNMAYEEIEEQQRIETITNKQNEIIEKYSITPEELEVIRAK